MLSSCGAAMFSSHFALNILLALVGLLAKTYYVIQSALVALEKVILMSASKILMPALRNMPQFMVARRGLDIKNMIISNVKVKKNIETRINKIHPNKLKLLSFKIHRNKRNTLYNSNSPSFAAQQI